MEAEWYGPAQLERCDRMQLEHRDICSVLDFCLTETGRNEKGLEIATALAPYWHASGSASQGRYWVERLLKLHPEPTRLRVKALLAVGFFGLQDNDIEGTQWIAAEAHKLARRVGDPCMIAWAMTMQANLELCSGDPARAAIRIEYALSRHRDNSDQVGCMFTQFLLSCGALLLGDLNYAVALQEESLELCESLGESWQRASMLWMLGPTLTQRHCTTSPPPATACP
jgi:non-specific serine/threonine protein kinase